MSRRTMVVLAVVVVLVGPLMVACAAPASESTEAPAASGEVITWKGQCQFAAGSIEYESFVRASDMITELSGGRLVAKPYPSGAIAPGLEVFDATDSGTLDYGWDPCNYWRGKWVVAGLFDNEINGMSPVEQFLWYLHGGGVELAREMTEGYGVYLPRSGALFPPEIFLNSTKRLDSLADIKGLKIRTAGDDGAVFTEMGASIIMVPGGEIYESMQRGVIDAFQFMSPAGDWTMGFHEVTDYVYLSPVRQPCSTSTLIVNNKQWEELSPDLQGIVEYAFLGEAWQLYAAITQEDAEAVQRYIDYGVTVGPPPADIEAEVARVAEEMYNERAAEDPFYARVLESRHQFQQRLRDTYIRL